MVFLTPKAQKKPIPLKGRAWSETPDRIRSKNGRNDRSDGMPLWVAGVTLKPPGEVGAGDSRLVRLDPLVEIRPNGTRLLTPRDPEQLIEQDKMHVPVEVGLARLELDVQIVHNPPDEAQVRRLDELGENQCAHAAFRSANLGSTASNTAFARTSGELATEKGIPTLRSALDRAP